MRALFLALAVFLLPVNFVLAETLSPDYFSTNPSDWNTTHSDITFVDGKVRVTNSSNEKGSATLYFNFSSDDNVRIVTSGKNGNGEAWVFNPFKGVGINSTYDTTFSNSGALTIRSNGTGIGDYIEYDYFQIYKILDSSSDPSISQDLDFSEIILNMWAITFFVLLVFVLKHLFLFAYRFFFNANT